MIYVVEYFTGGLLTSVIMGWEFTLLVTPWTHLAVPLA